MDFQTLFEDAFDRLMEEEPTSFQAAPKEICRFELVSVNFTDKIDKTPICIADTCPVKQNGHVLVLIY